ncbi:MAG TPA: sarcosine oxidase subunit gamma family protein [Chloroflexota bacterium]|jgi:sarcosine oxidase subunit gamma
MANPRYVPQLNVRASGEVVQRVGTALGVALPIEPNTVASIGQRSALWLGPDEWLIVDEGPLTTEDDVRAAFAPDWGAVVDVSANRVVFEVQGPTARDLLAHGCPLDLHPRVFGPGQCAQTLLARAAVILWQTDDAPTYRILVRASFAEHLARWLADATSA